MTQACPSLVDQVPAPLRPEAVLTPLIVEFLEWLVSEPRGYAEVMEFWRTSCPRLPIWEDAVDQGLVVRRAIPGQPAVVDVTEPGRRLLEAARSVWRTT